MNESGIRPLEYKVLIKPDQVEEVSKGGIILVDQTKDKQKFATDCGELIAVGAIAFTEPDWLDRPQVGDKVLYDRYAGSLVRGTDGVEYRLMNDKEIGAVLTGKVETVTSK